VDDEPVNEGTGDPPQVPGERRPERQLERPPSDRYQEAGPVPASDAGRSPRWGTVAAVLTSLMGAVAIAIAGGKLTIPAGLLVIAGVLGWLVAGLASMGADPTSGRTGRRGIATVLALGGVALGQIGLWLIGRQEGGTLGLIDYLAEVFGFLVPLQFALAGAIAWWRTA
jgi:hypothetical protein